ncbi:MAG: hypothetical protein R3C12_18995 [Planctomycetaceae bacterium]
MVEAARDKSGEVAAQAEAAARAGFERLDKNGDGFIDPAEARSGCSNVSGESTSIAIR